MNLAEKNLNKIQEEIGDTISKLSDLNSESCHDFNKNLLDSAQDLSSKLSDLYAALSHQEEVLSDAFKRGAFGICG